MVVTVRRGDWSVSSKPSQPVNVEAGAPTDRMEFRLPPMTVASAKPREGVYFGYTGYMTYVIEIRKGQFRYWFESDAKSRREPTYPLEGKYSIDGDTITLHHKELISLTSIWKCRSVNGIPTLWRHDAIEHHENEPLELSVEHLRRWGSGSILARTTRSGEVMWNERTAPGLTAPYRPARKRPDFHVQISLLVDGEAFDEKKLLSESVISSVVKDKALNGLTAGSKEGWLRSRLHVERIRKSNLVVVSMARETDRDDTDSFESILNVVAREIIAQAGPDARVQIVSSPTLSSTCQTSPDGTVEYVWSIKGAIGGDRLLSKIELIRNRRDNPLIRGYERSTWSKAKSMHERKLTMSVHPPVNGKEKTIEFTGADTRKILIPDSASVSVTTHQVRREEQVRHVINITVSNNGLILNHHVFVVWLSHPSQLVHYDGLLEQVHDHQDKGDSITWLTYGGFLPPDNAERCFRRYAALDK